MIATRYVGAVAGLLALALVPTVVHSYLGLRVDDGRRTEVIPSTLADAREAPLDRPSTWTKPQFRSTDAFERLYMDGAGRSARLVVIRSYDIKTVYHHPENAVAYGMGYESAEVVRLPALPAVPIHVLRKEFPDPAVALYALHYDQGFIEDPYAFQVRLAWTQVFRVRKPATLLFARGEGRDLDPLDASLPAKVLVAAINAFVAPSPVLTGAVQPRAPHADSW